MWFFSLTNTALYPLSTIMIASNKIYFLPVKTIPRVNSNLLVCALNKLYFVDVVCDYLKKRFYSLRIGLCWEGTWSPDKSRHTVGKKKSINVSWARFKDTDSKIKEPPSYKGQLCSWCMESEQTLLSWDEFPSPVRVVRQSKDGTAYNDFFFELDLCISSVV